MRFKIDAAAPLKITGIRPELVAALMVAQRVFDDLGADFVVTSCAEHSAAHSNASLHYAGSAFDCRIHHMLIKHHAEAVKMLKERLTDEFDVVLEKDHIHVEFQPKRIRA